MKKEIPTESVYWEKEIETLPRSDLDELQLNRLRETVRKVQAVPFYQERFKAELVDPAKIMSTDSITSLPFTEKEDLRTISLTDCWRSPLTIASGSMPLRELQEALLPCSIHKKILKHGAIW